MIVERPGVTLFAETRGNGPTLLFHTGAAGDHEMWIAAGYVRELSDYRCVLLDHRGRGGSGRPKSSDQHRLEQYVEDAAAFVRALGDRQAVYVG